MLKPFGPILGRNLVAFPQIVGKLVAEAGIEIKRRNQQNVQDEGAHDKKKRDDVLSGRVNPMLFVKR